MRSNTVFLFDVDNTLLDNDRVTADLRDHLEREVGHECQEGHWSIFEELRAEVGYADYLGALQRYRASYPHDLHVLTVSRSPYIWRGLRKAGFTGGWLESERQPECREAVKGRWREGGTPFSKLSEAAKPSERPDPHPTATMRAARIHSYGDPTGVKVVRAPRPEPGRGQVLIGVKAAGVNPLDWMVAEGKARSWLDHRLPLTLGWELAGIVEKVGDDANSAAFAPSE